MGLPEQGERHVLLPIEWAGLQESDASYQPFVPNRSFAVISNSPLSCVDASR